MSVPVLSILIPFHSSPAGDRRAMLVALLNSIPDREDLEVIVVDDRSELPFTEDPGFDLTSFRMSRTPDGTRFAGAARNQGLKIANGQFALYADSDDLFDPSALNTLVDTLRDRPASDRLEVHLLETYEFTSKPETSPESLLYRHVLSGSGDADVTRRLCQWHSPWGKVFSRKAALQKDVRSQENQQVANDTLFSTRLALAADIVIAHRLPAYFVRRDHDAAPLTGRADKKSIRTRIGTTRTMNDCLAASGRKDLIVPMHHPFRRFFRVAPLLVCQELASSLIRGDRILPHFRRPHMTRQAKSPANP